MPPCFDRRIRIHNGKIIAETVSLFDPDAALSWRFDAACHTPRGLRNLVVMWDAALTSEGGLAWKLREEMMDVVAERYDSKFTHPPHWCLPSTLGGDTAMVLPRHDLHCSNTEYQLLQGSDSFCYQRKGIRTGIKRPGRMLRADTVLRMLASGPDHVRISGPFPRARIRS